MTIELAPLPFAKDALEPHMSVRTFDFHHGKHHKAYVDRTNALIAGTPLEKQDLPAIVRAAKADGNTGLFNASAQAWNHTFFWEGLKPGGGGDPSGALADAIKKDFGDFAAFRKAFTTEATGHFASGWAWLVLKDGKLAVQGYHDADTPLAHEGVTPLLTLDVWEHAYYLDYQNARPAFVEAFFDHLVNWDEVARRFAQPA